MFQTAYYGTVSIQFWEYALMFFYVLGMYLYFAREKNLRIKKQPEYKYFLYGLYAKVIGGIFFALIYFYYYVGGDTLSYFYSSLALSKLFKVDPSAYLHVVFGANTRENLSYFTLETGIPYSYMYDDPRTYMVIRLISPVIILSFDSYLITTVTVASLSYIGVWRCYQTFHRYFPKLRTELAIAFLFMPSCIFWGSSILKDTFSFSAVCWYLHAFDNLVFRRRSQFSSIVQLLVSVSLILAVKPYIFMALMPISMLWSMYGRISRIRNALVKYVLMPAAFALLLLFSIMGISLLGGSLGKFSLDNALQTIMVTQNDMKRGEQYGNNYFDIGTLEPTWSSLLGKMPAAVNATLFRPYLWECTNVVMLLAGIENLFILWLTLKLLWRSRIFSAFAMVLQNPIIMLCISFSLLYGFLTGISTPNFGALVRFKIPLLPLYVGGLYIMLHLLDRKRYARAMGLHFDMRDFLRGDPDVPLLNERRERQ